MANDSEVPPKPNAEALAGATASVAINRQRISVTVDPLGGRGAAAGWAIWDIVLLPEYSLLSSFVQWEMRKCSTVFSA
jgi:hypothetical protein